MSKKPFEQYILEITKKTFGDNGFSPSQLAFYQKAYSLGARLEMALAAKSEGKARELVNASLRLGHRIQYHGIGKNPGSRYFAYAASDLNSIPDWQVVEQYLIPHFYSIKKDSTNIANLTIAKKLGWLRENEMDPQITQAVERRVVDALRILKEIRKTMSVEQRYTPGFSGSHHVITANWVEIITLYSTFNPDLNMTIRERKGIRRRIFSLLSGAMGFVEGLKKLLLMQRTKWLKGLVTMDPEIYRQNRIILETFAKGIPNNGFMEYDKLIVDPNQCVPDLDMSENGISFLYAKNPRAYTILIDLVEAFSEKFKLNRSLIIRRDYQKQNMPS